MKEYKTIRSFYLFVVALLIALPQSGRADADDHVSAETIRIEANEFSFSVVGSKSGKGPVSLVAGKTYRLTLVNKGRAEHEVLLGKNAFQDGFEWDYKEHLLKDTEITLEFNGSYVETNGLLEIELKPRAEMSVVFSIPPEQKGQWEIGCFFPGHYNMGMKIPLLIQ